MVSKSHKWLPLLLRTTLPLSCYPNYFVPFDYRWGNEGSEKLNHLPQITQLAQARARIQALAVGAPQPQLRL